MRSYLMSMRGRCEVSYQWVSIHRSSVRVAYAAGTILVDRCEHATSYLTLDEVACYFRIPPLGLGRGYKKVVCAIKSLESYVR